MLTVSRWYEPAFPDETGRMISLAVATLMEAGVREPRRHLFLTAQKRIATLVLSKAPFSADDVEALEKASATYEHEILITPSRAPRSSVLSRIVDAPDLSALWRFTSSLPFDLTPPTDGRPFFFNQLPLSRPLQAFAFARGVLATTSEGGGVRRGNLVATVTLMILFFIALLLVVAALVIPLRGALEDVGARLVTHGTLYFSLIGAGFMMIEIGLLQRMSIFLGHPVYSLSVLLFTLILSTGVGSFLSEKLPLDSRARLFAWGVATGVYGLALPFCLGPVFTAFDDSALAGRIALCVAFTAPAGILLGFGFPTGMRLISAIDPKPTPWFWGINGAAGVLASIGAIALSLALGISATLVVGALCYFLLIPVSSALLQHQSITATKKIAKRQDAARKTTRSPVARSR